MDLGKRLIHVRFKDSKKKSKVVEDFSIFEVELKFFKLKRTVKVEEFLTPIVLSLSELSILDLNPVQQIP